VTVTAHPNQRLASELPPELRRTTVPPPVRAWIGRETGSPVASVRRLAGASSTAVHRVGLVDGRRLVLRRYAWPGYLAVDPEASRREVDALRFAGQQGLPVPEVVAADVTGGDVGDGVPAVLMSMLSGRAVAVPDGRRLAEMLAQVHAVDAAPFAHAYYCWCVGDMDGPPRHARRPCLWERAVEVWHTAMPEYRPVFIHRDFHPGNVLWARGRCTGIVDWPEACRGPAGCDVAHCRSELSRLADIEVADSFRAAYEAITGEPHHPYWEIASVMEHDPSHWDGGNVPQAERRLGLGLAAIGVRTSA